MLTNCQSNMANEDDLDQMRKDEIFALCEIFSDTCKKEDDDVLTFEISEPEFKDKKIKLQVRFTESYPRSDKPDHMIIADWLPNDLIKSIKLKLDEVWRENLNQPVVYLWIEAVKESVLRWIDGSAKNGVQKKEMEQVSDQFHNLNMSSKQKDMKSTKKEKFEFIYGQPLVVKRSVFQAHLLHIDDESKIPFARQQLMEESKRVQEATHNIMAYRIIKTLGDRTIEHSNYDDDGETQAGNRLHLLLKLTDSKNVLIVVSRYFGGTKLGPDRFKYINEVAKVLLQEQGLICPKEGKQQQQKGKKKK